MENNQFFARIEERLRAVGLSPRAASLQATGNPDTIRRIKAGRLKDLKSDDMAALAAVLQTSPEYLRGELDAPGPTGPTPDFLRPVTTGPTRISKVRGAVPVRGTAAGSLLKGAFQLDQEAFDYVDRPAALVDARDLYAIYVVGDSMYPEHRNGDLRFIHPHRPPRIGDSVIVQTIQQDGGMIEATIGHLQVGSDVFCRLGKLNPEATIEIAQETIYAMHRVLTMNELFGA